MKNKLKSNSGVTVIFALIVFLIATMFSVTMVNGALSAVMNATEQRAQEQSFLSVTSAADLLRAHTQTTGTPVGSGSAYFVQKTEAKVYKDGSADNSFWKTSLDDAAVSVRDLLDDYRYYRNSTSDAFYAPEAYNLTVSQEQYQTSRRDAVSQDDLVMVALKELLEASDPAAERTLDFTAPASTGAKNVTATLKLLGSMDFEAALKSDSSPAYSTRLIFTGEQAAGTETQKYTHWRLETYYVYVMGDDGTPKEVEKTRWVEDYTLTVEVKTTTLTWTLDGVERGNSGV